VKNIREFGAVALCLAFTGNVAWGDPTTAEYVEDPMAPHHTTGARPGSALP